MTPRLTCRIDVGQLLSLCLFSYNYNTLGQITGAPGRTTRKLNFLDFKFRKHLISLHKLSDINHLCSCVSLTCERQLNAQWTRLSCRISCRISIFLLCIIHAYFSIYASLISKNITQHTLKTSLGGYIGHRKKHLVQALQYSTRRALNAQRNCEQRL